MWHFWEQQIQEIVQGKTEILLLEPNTCDLIAWNRQLYKNASNINTF